VRPHVQNKVGRFQREPLLPAKGNAQFLELPAQCYGQRLLLCILNGSIMPSKYVQSALGSQVAQAEVLT
jgi:hypothetical protein